MFHDQLVDEIREDIKKRFMAQPDSRCASDDEVSIAYLLSKVDELHSEVESLKGGSDEDDPSKSYYPAFKASLDGTDQGNDSLGLGMVKVTWKEDGGEDGEGKPSAIQSHQVPSTQVTDFCAHLAGPGHCIDILVNGVSEYDYLKQCRGDDK
jgi:hypothetical protein